MPTTKANDLLDEIKFVLNQSGVNLMELSRVTGVSYNTLRSLKAGTANPTIKLLDRIYEACGRTELPGKTCEDCHYCLSFDVENSCYACEHHLGGFKTDPTACILHVQWEGDQ